MFPKKAITNILHKSSFLTNLSRYGFACADLPTSTYLDSLRSDILTLQDNAQLVPNWSRFLSSNTTTALQKSGIYEDNLPVNSKYSPPSLETLWIERDWVTDEINDITAKDTYSILPKLAAPSIKIQYNSGQGACFPCHYDSDAKVDDRCVTLILYLNPEYLIPPINPIAAQEQGGHFVAYPIPFPPISYSPSMGRLVAFSSRNMLHRTLPCNSKDPRVCLTLWFPSIDSSYGVEHKNEFMTMYDATTKGTEFMTGNMKLLRMKYTSRFDKRLVGTKAKDVEWMSNQLMAPRVQVEDDGDGGDGEDGEDGEKSGGNESESETESENESKNESEYESESEVTIDDTVDRPILTRADFNPFVKISDVEIKVLNLLLLPKLRSHFSRLILAGEWIESLKASHSTNQSMNVDTMEMLEGGVDKYIGTMVQDLTIIEKEMIKQIHLADVDVTFTAMDLRELCSKLPMSGDRHQQSQMNWWV